MASLLSIVDSKGRLNYKQLLEFVSSCPLSTFNDQAKNPFLVGKELYEGELRKAKDASPVSTSTMRFSVAALRERLNPNSANTPKKEVEVENTGISHAIYMLRKNMYSYEKNPNIITVGRRSDNDIVIADYVVSKAHAQIIIFRGMYFIVDINSTNGTMVNNRPLAPHMKVQLNNNASVAFGRLCFVLTSPLDLYRGLRKEIHRM